MSFFQDEMNELNSNLASAKARIASIKGLKEAQEGQKQSGEDAYISHLEMGAGITKTLPTEASGIIRGGGGVIRTVGRYSTDAGGAFATDAPRTAQAVEFARVRGGQISSRVGQGVRDLGDQTTELGRSAVESGRGAVEGVVERGRGAVQSARTAVGNRLDQLRDGRNAPRDYRTTGFETDDFAGGDNYDDFGIRNPVRPAIGTGQDYPNIDIITSDPNAPATYSSGGVSATAPATTAPVAPAPTAPTAPATTAPVAPVDDYAEAGRTIATRAGASTAEDGALISAETVADTASAAEGFLNPIADATALGLGGYGAFKAVTDLVKHNHNHPAQEAREAQAGADASISSLASALNSNHHQAITGGFANMRQSQQSGSSF